MDDDALYYLKIYPSLLKNCNKYKGGECVNCDKCNHPNGDVGSPLYIIDTEPAHLIKSFEGVMHQDDLDVYTKLESCDKCNSHLIRTEIGTDITVNSVVCEICGNPIKPGEDFICATLNNKSHVHIHVGCTLDINYNINHNIKNSVFNYLTVTLDQGCTNVSNVKFNTCNIIVENQNNINFTQTELVNCDIRAPVACRARLPSTNGDGDHYEIINGMLKWYTTVNFNRKYIE